MTTAKAEPAHAVTSLYTLGPTGTNCERAARTWLTSRGVSESSAVRLFPSLEAGVDALPDDPSVGLLGCVVYPDLHQLVFTNLDRLELVDCFVLDTHEMVLADRGEPGGHRVVASHPAPVALVPPGLERVEAGSNAAAARACARGEVDACITTAPAAEACGLRIARRFGPIPMGFTIHAQRER